MLHLGKTIECWELGCSCIMVNTDSPATGNDLDELENMTLDHKATDQNRTEVCTCKYSC